MFCLSGGVLSLPADRVRVRAVLLFFIAQLLFTTLLTSQLPGQDDTRTSNNSEQNKYTLTGTVVNSVTGAPVPRALVTIFTGAQKSVLTNAEGHFEFTGLPASQTGVNVEKPGFFSEEQTRSRTWSPPTLIAVGPDTPAVALKLVPESVIAGQITSNGEPVEDVPVRVISVEIQEGRKQWLQQGGATSDEDGQFRIANLQQGEYYLEVGPKWVPGGPGLAKGHEGGYGKVFYPGAPAIESATPLMLATGQRAEVELSLKLEPWYRISGTVRANEAALNWNLQLVDATGKEEGASRANQETGEFETRAPAGNYILRGVGFGPNGMSSSTDVPLTVNSDMSGLEVTLGPGISIPVTVKTEGTGKQQEQAGSGNRPSPVRFRGRGGEVSDTNGTPPSISMWIRRSGFNEGAWNPVITAAGVNQAGKAEGMAVRNIVSGTYWLEIGRPQSWYVQSAQCGNLDLLRESFTVAGGAPCPAIEVVLREDGATLKVRGTWDGEPAQGILVLAPENAPQQAMMTPLAKGSEAEFGDLAPGDYSIVLLDRGDKLEYKNPEAMSAYSSKAAHVTLAPNQTTSVNVEMAHAGR